MSTYLPMYCFKCAQDTVKHGTSVIEWSGYTLIQMETGSFTVLEHKTVRLCLLSDMLLIFIQVHLQIQC